jgi:ElaB/YqjD/DUF883 family membrane-anchored ribosome-binding protein
MCNERTDDATDELRRIHKRLDALVCEGAKDSGDLYEVARRVAKALDRLDDVDGRVKANEGLAYEVAVQRTQIERIERFLFGAAAAKARN